jgi:hypothetical protein
LQLAGPFDGDGDGREDVLEAGFGLAAVAAVAHAVAAGGLATVPSVPDRTA